jgi:hypothetical protein
VFSAAHPAVGELAICDDDTEATIHLGELTHSHFNPYDAALSREEVAHRVVDDVVEFLHELFSDRVLIWSAPDGKSGGWQRPFENIVPGDAPLGQNSFVWSGPVARSTRRV